MPKFIELSMVIGRADPHEQHSETEIDREGEDDGIVDVTLAPATPTAGGERTSKTSVQVDQVRNFYPRKQRTDGVARVGTRITFANGSGMAVTETYERVKELLDI
jgi:hypothetical protein